MSPTGQVTVLLVCTVPARTILHAQVGHCVPDLWNLQLESLSLLGIRKALPTALWRMSHRSWYTAGRRHDLVVELLLVYSRTGYVYV